MSNFVIDRSPSIFELQRRSKAQNVGDAHGYQFDLRFDKTASFQKEAMRTHVAS